MSKKPGKVWLKSREDPLNCRHIDKHERYVHAQLVEDGLVVSENWPWDEIRKVRIPLGAEGDCPSVESHGD